MRDLHGRVINYLRISLTENCNLSCIYCRPDKCIEAKKDFMTKREVVSIVEAMAELGVKKVRFTGGEPLLRKDITEIISEVSKIDGIDDIALTTNGIFLAEKAKELKDAGLMRVNVSIDTLEKEKYRGLTGGNLDMVLEGIKRAEQEGLHPVKLNVVLMKSYNSEEIENFVKITVEKEMDVRFIELMPMGSSVRWIEKEYLSSQEVLNRCPRLQIVEKDYAASPSLLYKFPEGKGRVGIINTISNKFCDSCNRVRITPSGKLKLCLHSNKEIDLLGALRKDEDILELFRKNIPNKPEKHLLDKKHYNDKDMYKIGG
ncbi:GTP 3',8-cyclase MoaA [uncultured Ilyobacter sp.]|uniref:GTP 3',8-cyclase MoaA n=1 Tax=uncultured Ilyobacter sp. TaxID=544433 RepID=UPI0029C93625|nr:GTP 3',8-cyclase MoaA [uncultured Ilyobacter sp.]